jgi:hypothetical protein
MNLVEQAQQQLKKISVTQMQNIEILQKDKSTVWFRGMMFGKYEEKFTVSLTPTGKVKNASVRFYE